MRRYLRAFQWHYRCRYCDWDVRSLFNTLAQRAWSAHVRDKHPSKPPVRTVVRRLLDGRG